MSFPEFIDTIKMYGKSIPARMLCGTWLYVRTDYYIDRSHLFWLARDDSYYRVEEVLATNSSYQKFRVAKLPPVL